MRFLDIVADNYKAQIQNNNELEVCGLAYDSREVKANYVFFAFAGLHVDGHNYIQAAIDNGAIAVVHDKPCKVPSHVSSLCVADARIAMSDMAAAFYDYPSSKLKVIGVTGTEGKSSCVYYIYRLLDLAGKKAGFFSTVEYKLGPKIEPNPKHQTTPESITVQEHLAKMVDSGFEYAVIEASSHGLSKKTGRLQNVLFDAGLATNVKHEHMEFHGSWDIYRSDKANLFRALDSHEHVKTINGIKQTVNSFGFICADDAGLDYFKTATNKQVFSYSSKTQNCDIYADEIISDKAGSSFTINTANKKYKARIELPGTFNVENIIAALGIVANITGLKIEALVPLLNKIEPVHGRMTRIIEGQDFELIVDYAHTPSSFEAILQPLRASTKANIICLFGSGGERDTQKRPQQGLIASTYCDIIIVTDEDPRGEEPLKIINDIAKGCKNKTVDKDLFLIADRKMAIAKALSLAKPGDTVILLGKSHEKTIDYNGYSIPWDEISEAKNALKSILCKN